MIALHEGSARPVQKGDSKAGSALVELTHTLGLHHKCWVILLLHKHADGAAAARAR